MNGLLILEKRSILKTLQFSISRQVAMRNRRDNWPTCGYCGSEAHAISNCLTDLGALLSPGKPVAVRTIFESPQRPACEVWD